MVAYLFSIFYDFIILYVYNNTITYLRLHNDPNFLYSNKECRNINIEKNHVVIL